MARLSYLLNHSPITNLVCIKYGYGKYTIIIIIIIIMLPGPSWTFLPFLF
jgi:hypothetical protein